jgi:hypothetical protein
MKMKTTRLLTYLSRQIKIRNRFLRALEREAGRVVGSLVHAEVGDLEEVLDQVLLLHSATRLPLLNALERGVGFSFSALGCTLSIDLCSSDGAAKIYVSNTLKRTKRTILYDDRGLSKAVAEIEKDVLARLIRAN